MPSVSLRHAILGFLELEPTTGYTLLQRFQGSVGSFWTATQSQIYRELHALEAQGHVRVEVVPQDGKPARKIYELTELGRSQLRRWLEEPAEPLQLRDPFQLRLVFSAEVESRKLDAVLEQYAAGMRATLAEYTERRDSPEIFAVARSSRERALWELSIDNGISWCEAQLGWLDKARKRLARTPLRAAGNKKRRRRS
jgi:DNA-binding PadR family transcriptional regulator